MARVHVYMYIQYDTYLYGSLVPIILCPQLNEGGASEETDALSTSEPAQSTKKRWWKQSGEKKPQKFGWIMGVLVSI